MAESERFGAYTVYECLGAGGMAIGGKRLDTRADIFSAGVVMWELIATKRLFNSESDYDLIVQVREGLVSPPSQHNPDCPRELDDIVLQALATNDLFAEGSDMETYDDPVEIPEEPPPEAERRRFLDSDTVITEEATIDRKR